MSTKLSIDAMMDGGFHRMSHVYRYSSIPTIRKENVAEHSWYVAFYAYLIGKDLEANNPSLTVDYGVLLSRALLHDLDESHTGDFLRIIKYGHPDLKKALDVISCQMIEKMSKELQVNLFPGWEDAKHDDLEGHIVQIVDLARVVSYVSEEMKLGNQHIAPILHEVQDYFVKYAASHAESPVVPYALEIVEWIASRMKK